MKQMLALVVFALLLVACSNTAVPAPTPTPVPYVVNTRTVPALGLSEYGVCRESNCLDTELEQLVFSAFAAEVASLQEELQRRHGKAFYEEDWFFYSLNATRWHNGGTFYVGARQETKICPRDIVFGEQEDFMGAGGTASSCEIFIMPEQGYLTADWSSGSLRLIDSGFAER